MKIKINGDNTWIKRNYGHILVQPWQLASLCMVYQLQAHFLPSATATTHCTEPSATHNDRTQTPRLKHETQCTRTHSHGICLLIKKKLEMSMKQ